MTNKYTIRRIIAVFLVIALLCAISYYIYLSISRSGKLKLEMAIAPNDAKVTLLNTETNNSTAGRNGDVYVEKGNYKITVEKNGFKAYSKEVDISKDDVFVALLEPETDEAREWASKNNAQFTKVEGVAGKQAALYGDELSSQYPLVKKLPIKDAYYSIGYYKKDEQLIVVISTPSPQYRYLATRKIISMGYKISDYNIEYKDYKNPLGEN